MYGVTLNPSPRPGQILALYSNLSVVYLHANRIRKVRPHNIFSTIFFFLTTAEPGVSTMFSFFTAPELFLLIPSLEMYRPLVHKVSSPSLLSSLPLSDTHVYEPSIRSLLGTAAHFCEVVVLKLRKV